MSVRYLLPRVDRHSTGVFLGARIARTYFLIQQSFERSRPQLTGRCQAASLIGNDAFRYVSRLSAKTG
jgi:hypothetical protein